MLALLAVSSAASGAEGSEPWTFTSLYGHEHTLAQDAQGNYSISVADVTETVMGCEARSYRICFSSRYLSVAIPTSPPEKDSSWVVGPTTFTVRAIVDESNVLGHELRDLYVIDVERRPAPPLDTVTHRFRLFFTYTEGLAAFAVQDEDGELIPYFAPRLPSLGAASRS